MGIFDAVCQTIASSGHRRGAQMGVLRIDHPDIEQFITAKHDSTTLTGFNISVGVTDKFMNHLAEGKPFPLEFEGKVYKEVDPVALWDMIMRSTWDWAEPGVLFIDQNEQEEQPLVHARRWKQQTRAVSNVCQVTVLVCWGRSTS